MDQEKQNGLPELENATPPVSDDLEDLLGPELMAILGRPTKTEPVEFLDTPEPEPAPAQPEPPKQEEEEYRFTPPVRRRRRRTSKGTRIFYTVYVALVIVLITTIIAVTVPLRNWLVSYEASQPEQRSQETFQVLFANPDWAVIYDLAEEQGTDFEGKETYVEYMTGKVASAENKALSYQETSAGLSGNRKYYVNLGTERIAAFTMTPKKDSEGNTTDWMLGLVELFFDRTHSVTVQKQPGWTVYINGIALDDSYTVRTVSTVAEKYLPEGTHGFRMEEQFVTGLLKEPTVSAVDARGNAIDLTYDADSNTYLIPGATSIEMTDEERTLALDAAKANALFAIRAITAGTLRDYFDPNSQIYSDLRDTDVWMQSYRSYKFDETVSEVTEFCRYTDSLFTARVKLKLDVTRSNGTVKSLEQDTTYFLTKMPSGKYLVTQITNESLQQTVQQVRLNFVSNGQQLASMFVDTAAASLELPAVTAPEGQVFKGWAQQSVDENGKVTMTIRFIPGVGGQAAVPEDMTLEPMTFYAVFEREEAK